jgi:hypothetical protein
MRILNLQLKRQSCSRLERIYIEENIFYSKNVLSCCLHCELLQLWHCKLKSYDWVHIGRIFAYCAIFLCWTVFRKVQK